LQSSIQRYNNSRGVKKTSAHLFRHYFAKNWILQKGDHLKLQKLMGWKTINMVNTYVNLYDPDLKEDLDIYNPLEKFSNKNKSISMKN